MVKNIDDNVTLIRIIFSSLVNNLFYSIIIKQYDTDKNL